LTVTLAIPLTGEALTPQTRRLLDALRELVELGQGAVTTTAVSSQSGAPDSAAFALPVQPGRHSSAFAAPTPDLTDAGSADGAAGRNGALVDGGWPDTDRIVFDGVGAPDADVPGPRVRPSANPTEVRLLTASRQVLIGGQPMAMTRLEFDLLLFLAGNPRRVFTRAQLLGAVWGYEHTGERTVDVHVRRLRVKMGVQVPLITTVYGVGYRLDDDARIVVVAHE
jgi:DNA-binding winged helix-turn-helix (wHTH) protein